MRDTPAGRRSWTARTPRSGALLLALPAALTLVLAFRAGGFFPGTTAWLAIALCIALLLRLTLAEAPLAGWSPLTTLLSGALAALAAWTLVSGAWSEAPARAVLEFDRALAYCLVTVLAGLRLRRRGDLAALLRWTALAIAVVALAGVLSRVLPALIPTELGFDPGRLAFPVTYWNAMGILMAVGAVLLLGTSGARDEPVWARLAAAAATPVVVGALLLTFSRGGVGAAVLGTIVLVAATPGRHWLFVGPAVALPSAAFVLVLLGADRLTSEGFAAGEAAGERGRVLVALAGCAAGALLLAALALRLERRRPAPERSPVHRGRSRIVLAAVALAAVGAALAAGFPGWLDEQRRAFAEGNVVPLSEDPASRLTQVGNNGRLALWRVGVDRFEAAPWKGEGAGTYELAWERHRPEQGQEAVDGHSLYVEVLAELGVPGLVLLLVALGAGLFALARGLPGAERPAHAAGLAAGLALLVHAGIDWDWEMPVLWIWFFAACGLAAARRAGDDRDRGGMTRMARIVAGLAVLVLALTPWSVARSQSALAASAVAFDRGDCARAASLALDSLRAFSARAEPLALLGYCNIRAGRERLAVDAMQAAVRRDPGGWEYRYGEAIALAVAGEDPRAALAAARRSNPQEPLARELDEALSGARRAEWPRIALRATIPRR